MNCKVSLLFSGSISKYFLILSLICLTNCILEKMDDDSSNIQDKSDGTSDLDISSSSNGIISAVRSKVNILGCSNFKVNGKDHSKVLLDSCSNVNLKGNKGCLQLTEASNIDIAGDSNQVQLERGSNVRIQGSGNKIVLKDISNHVLQPSQLKDTNVFEVKPSSMVGNFASSPGAIYSPTQSVKFNVDYVDSANIDGSKYNLGIYQFRVDINKSPFYADVRVDPAGLDGLKFAPNSDGRSAQMEGQGPNGLIQRLILKGPRVVQTSENVFRIDLNSYQGSL